MKKRKQTIYLFRHGQTTYNRDKRFTGHQNATLTKKGITNAKTVAKKLKDKRIDVAIHTKLSRSKDTLKYILRQHPECTTIMEDNRMIERSYGELEGMTHKQFIHNIGKQEYDLRIQGDSFTDLEGEQRKKVEEFLGKEEYKAIHRGWKVAAPKGESFADVEKRVKPFIKQLKKFMKKHKVNVAISAHGNSIRLFRKIMERTTKKKAQTWTIPYDHVYEYRI